MTATALALCVALATPVDTPGYTYRERTAGLEQCALEVLDTQGPAIAGPYFDRWAKCLSYCTRETLSDD